ncbi:MAG TPA: DUF429 domain-containing protein [Dermatophilaceae bacterium]|nr:DUF429 domain-containing protein [Dermatophilaceae bacterium]
MLTVGVDLAADPARTAACVIDWAIGRIEAISPVSDEQILELATTARVVGVDVPLGWPDDFVRAISAHHQQRPWPALAASTSIGRESLRYRRTDVLLRHAAHHPLSVSTDLIGVVALRAARLQHLLAAAGLTVDRSGITGVIVETYPAAALSGWRLPSRGYKGAKNRAGLASIVALVLDEAGPLRPAATSALAGCSDHILDAFICAVVAAAARLGITALPGPQDQENARCEGWIHVPTATLAEIVELAGRER